MNTRKLYRGLISGFVIAVGALPARADLTVALTPGSAREHAEEISKAAGTLRVVGTVDVRDFETLNSLPASVVCLDMSEMKVASRSTALPDAMGLRHHQESLIPPYAFFRCATQEVVFPEDCRLGEGVMACASTERVTLPVSLREIPSYSFYRSGVRRIEGLSTVSEVGSYSFYGASLESAEMPSIMRGGDYAMAAMPDLKEVTLSPTADLGIGFLMGCPSLERVSGAPANIPGYFAADSRRLDAERLAAQSETVGDYAIANARNTAVVLAKGLKSIGEGTFAGMTRLVMIEANPCGFEVPEAKESAFYGVDSSQATLYVAAGSGPVWKADAVWGRFNIVEGPSSVGKLDAAGSGIEFRLDGKVLDIVSAEPLESVEVYDPAGQTLLRENPGECGARIDLGAFADSKVVMVRAAGAGHSSSMKYVIR